MKDRPVNWISVLVTLVFILASGPGDLSAQAGRGRGVPSEGLPEKLRSLEVRDHFVSSSEKQVGVIHALTGHVVVVHQKTKEAYFGMAGDVVYESDSLSTIKDSRCRIRFHNDDVMTMAPDTEFSVDLFDDRRIEGSKRSLFGLVKGKAMFYALRLFRYKDARFTLKTPTAVVGVRGTKFGAHVYGVEGEAGDPGGVKVADSGDGIGNYLAQADPGAGGKSYTDAFCVDGYLDVDGRTVGPGEIYLGMTGQVLPAPPEMIRSFESDVEVSRGGAEGQEETEEGQEGAGEETGEDEDEGTTVVTDTGESRDPAGNVDIIETVTENTQQQTVTRTEEEEINVGISEGKTAERVSGIASIIVDSAGKAWADIGKGPIYTYGPNILTGGAETHVAYEREHEGNGLYKMVVQEESESNKDAKVTQFNWNDTPVPTPTLHYFQWNQGGSYLDDKGKEYLSWGWWEDTSGVDKGLIATGSGSYYLATSKIWEVEGRRTHPDYIAHLRQQGTTYNYSGEAKGVIASGAPGIPFVPVALSGPFSCRINFGSQAVSDFKIDATASGHAVHISGSGIVKDNGDIDVDHMTGTIDGNPVDPNHTDAGGAVFGGKAEGVGGDWRAHDGNFLNAAGEYHGKR